MSGKNEPLQVKMFELEQDLFEMHFEMTPDNPLWRPLSDLEVSIRNARRTLEES